ncbi:hypothetical protein QBC34DRAFT_159970 [Podospora aff. communis PSN243]|uniref:Uncharacterized protein n=1 Tax=Podospora aff. communis PSN243 TaxID=3040156 RepID=A0AAV9H1P6_9PEZI|nr:hypothetical protein QBC34DRAFT_159970 [Podospora aff. communis PSN243]
MAEVNIAATRPSVQGATGVNNGPQGRRPSIVNQIRNPDFTREEGEEHRSSSTQLPNEHGDGRNPCPICHHGDAFLRSLGSNWRNVRDEVLRASLRSSVEAACKRLDPHSSVGTHHRQIPNGGITNGPVPGQPAMRVPLNVEQEGRASPLPTSGSPGNINNGSLAARDAERLHPNIHLRPSGSTLRTVLGPSPVGGLGSGGNPYEGDGYPDPYGSPVPPTAPLFDGIDRMLNEATSHFPSTQMARQQQQADSNGSYPPASSARTPGSASSRRNQDQGITNDQLPNRVDAPASEVHNNQQRPSHPPPPVNGHPHSSQQQHQPPPPVVDEGSVINRTNNLTRNAPLPSRQLNTATPRSETNTTPNPHNPPFPTTDFFHRLEAFRQQIHQETHEFEVTITPQTQTPNHSTPVSQTLTVTVKPKPHPPPTQPPPDPSPPHPSRIPRIPQPSHQPPPGIQITNSGPTSFQFHLPTAPPPQRLTSPYPATDSFKARSTRGYGTTALTSGTEAETKPPYAGEGLHIRGAGLSTPSSSSSSLTSERAREKRSVKRQMEMKTEKRKGILRGGSKNGTTSGYFGACWRL